jgi:hypothetical protein
MTRVLWFVVALGFVAGRRPDVHAFRWIVGGLLSLVLAKLVVGGIDGLRRASPLGFLVIASWLLLVVVVLFDAWRPG